MAYTIFKKINIYLLLSLFLVISAISNNANSDNFRENHKEFCSKYVGKKITLKGNSKKITAKFCDTIYLNFAPKFEKQFLPMVSSLSDEFLQYKIKKFQIEDFVNKSIDSNQINCGKSSTYGNKNQFLKDFDYIIDCKIDNKMKMPFDVNIQLLFDSSRFFNAINVNVLVDSNMMGSEMASMLIGNSSTSLFFIDLMNYSIFTHKSESTLPQVQLINNMINLGIIKRFDIKDVKKVKKNSEWIGYVINMMDYGLNKGNERRKKMIFPDKTTYSNKDECYRKFKILFSKEPLLSMYPQTNDPQSSYIYGCIEN